MHRGCGDPQSGDRVLHAVDQTEQLVSLVVSTVVFTEEAPVADLECSPRLHVDHDDSARTDEQEVDIRPLGAGPPSVGEDGPTQLSQALQPGTHNGFAAAGDLVSRGLIARLLRQALMFACLEQGALSLVVRRSASRHAPTPERCATSRGVIGISAWVLEVLAGPRLESRQSCEDP